MSREHIDSFARWPAVSSIRDCVAVAKTRASAALPDVCLAESATSWLRTS
jgi:hypothetical protein